MKILQTILPCVFGKATPLAPQNVVAIAANLQQVQNINAVQQQVLPVAQAQQLPVQQPAPQQPAVQQLQLPVEQPEVQQLLVEQPEVQQPAVQQLLVDQPEVQQLLVDQPQVQQLVVEQPVQGVNLLGPHVDPDELVLFDREEEEIDFAHLEAVAAANAQQRRAISPVAAQRDEFDMDHKEAPLTFHDVRRALEEFSDDERNEMLDQMFPAPPQKAAPRATAAAMPVRRANPGFVIQGDKGLRQAEMTGSIFVALEGLEQLWDRILEANPINEIDLSEILRRGLASYKDCQDRLPADEPIPYEAIVESFDCFDVPELAVAKHFKVPRYPTLRYPSLGGPADLDLEVLAKAAEDVHPRVPDGSTYNQRIEELLYSLQVTVKNRDLLGALLFKGTQENPKTYGIFVKANPQLRSKFEFFLLDPNGINGKISLHRFDGPMMLKTYFTEITPVNLAHQEENGYWVMPLDKREVAEEEADESGDEAEMAPMPGLVRTLSTHQVNKPQAAADEDGDADNETETF